VSQNSKPLMSLTPWQKLAAISFEPLRSSVFPDRHYIDFLQSKETAQPVPDGILFKSPAYFQA
jgi:hypothetical protein